MDFWIGLKVYTLIAVALAGTSYMTLFRPSIELLEEIVEEEQISFEQLDETLSNIKEQNYSVVEEFSNKTISKKDS